MEDYQRLTPLEIAGGVPIGLVGPEVVPACPPSTRAGSVADALEAALLPALQRQPCLVSFSGGRDSSLVLAAAVRAARRHGLPDPVPITLRFPGIESAEESSWQELMVESLGIDDWVIISARQRLELLGPEAVSSLERRGVLWPVTLHTFHVLLGHARGGALITGEGGDEYLGGRRSAALRYLLDRRGRIARRHARPVALSLAPTPVRRRVALESVRRSGDRAWMRTRARRDFWAAVIGADMSEPLRWNLSRAWLDRRRSWVVGRENRRVRAAEHDVVLHDPLTEPLFTDALARAGGAAGFLDRTHVLRHFFSDLLPEEVIARTSKAHFSEAYAGPSLADFARRWSGEGVDDTLVDPGRLRAEWLAPQPHAGTLLLLHQAWVAQRPHGNGG